LLLTVCLILLFKSLFQSREIQFSSASEATASAKTKIQVDVEGAVVYPGVYEFAEGSRVSDALLRAGGLSAAADRDWVAKSLNKAAKLADGGKIYIPSANESVSSRLNPDLPAQAGSLLGSSTGKVSLNTASSSELEVLPGVGPVTAGKIIAGRPYQTIDELKKRKIVGAALFEKIKDLLTVF
jgi:competence protein ComEA